MQTSDRHSSQRRHSGRTRSLVIGGIAILMIGLVAISVRNTARVDRANPTDAQQIALGQRVYAANCASCHGANLEGQANWQQELPTGGWPAPPHDETGHTWHHDDQSLFTTIKEGGQATSPPGYKSMMPAFGQALSDNEIWAVLAYIKSTWSPEIQAAQQAGHQ
jgi:mono/diheme cytochrome c family protein